MYNIKENAPRFRIAAGIGFMSRRKRCGYIITIGKCSGMDFAQRLCELREDADLKQIELADKINLKPSAVSKYEKGHTQPTIETLIQLAKIFCVSLDYLLGISNVKNPYATENFTPEEVNLILKFRALSNDNKIRIDERMNSMLVS
ncbi:MAG: helix-turn-helix domain-containing protein [Oscillospiraceae bacterium]|jgi:transcriptional regulator with XRE-family HTH domain|nr:helix-turn-helix domain-containing protein [Oscillospiraceae bacterium]